MDSTKRVRNADLEKVTKLFRFLLRYTQKDNAGFQIIVTEHANLSEDWFQECIVEEPWLDPPALIPANWPNIEN